MFQSFQDGHKKLTNRISTVSGSPLWPRSMALPREMLKEPDVWPLSSIVIGKLMLRLIAAQSSDKAVKTNLWLREERRKEE